MSGRVPSRYVLVEAGNGSRVSVSYWANLSGAFIGSLLWRLYAKTPGCLLRIRPHAEVMR